MYRQLSPLLMSDSYSCMPYQPPIWLKNPHWQSFVNSRIRKPWLRISTHELEADANAFILKLANNTRLRVVANLQDSSAPTIVILAGLFGGAYSSYVLSVASYLWRQGYSVVRLVLKDHGGTAGLNRSVFSAGEINEVSESLNYIVNRLATGNVGLLGFSMGGNFAIRLNRLTSIKTLAVCPVLDPAASIQRIDDHWLYRRFFVNKWHRIIKEKTTTFPESKELKAALKLESLAELTRFFVGNMDDSMQLDVYFKRYTLTTDQLGASTSTVLYSVDDPIIPAREYDLLQPPTEVIATRYGGHCAFLKYSLSYGWVDQFASDYFRSLHMV